MSSSIDSVSSSSSSRANFSSVPILDYALLESSKPNFIAQDIAALIDYIPKLFALPQEEKEKIRMVHSPHFLGYSRLGAELTKDKVDHGEQFDFATRHETRWREGEDVPEYGRLWGPSQWPEESLIPGFHADAGTIPRRGTSPQLYLYIPAFRIVRSRTRCEKMQHRAKIVQYPVVTDPSADDQRVGPHYDAEFLTFVRVPSPPRCVANIAHRIKLSTVLQASAYKGLQVQNLTGEWIDAPSIPGTFAVNKGLARATSHRVLSPRGASAPGEPALPRYSVPFFQNISLDVKLAEKTLEFPPEILKLKEGRGKVAATDSVNFSEFDREPSGQVGL
ncbi:hypothetical protein D9615_008523 [Tricholomella constricta]|uniref:Fe2OG dioxygenase domain-containing protein n=1 Tax=Tricholomella constricta TaxID=117010 RepID=A0A8H5H3T9_9AGAR|nr:hypothetical protein D9615_008523 [Tricholomella constricta]